MIEYVANEEVVITKPNLSVITIVKNGIPFVEQTIKSVLSQTYSNLEYIIIDGVSTDGTLDVIRSHESEITKWVSEKDDGISDAFNKGLSLAEGDYLMFLNADDALANSTVLEEMAKKIVENEFPTLIYGDCDVLDRESDHVLYRASIDFSTDGLRRGQMLPHPGMLTSRVYFDKYGIFDLNFEIAMDYEWLLRGGLKERIVHESVIVTNVRDGGVSTKYKSKVVSEIIAALKKNHYISSKWAELKMRSYFSLRAFAKEFLERIGLYSVFSHARDSRASLKRSDQENK